MSNDNHIVNSDLIRDIGAAQPIPIGVVPQAVRSVVEALGAARDLGFEEIVIVGWRETDGTIVLSAKTDDLMTRAEAVYYLEKGKLMVMGAL